MKKPRVDPDEIAIVCDNAKGTVTYLQGDVEQSMADADGVSLADYIHAIFGLVLQAKPRNALLIGCGGGTLGTMLHAKGVKVTMLDIHETSFMIARRHFRVPRGVKCLVADGLEFLRASTKRYDVIVVDAYAGPRIPRQFLTQSFMRLVASRLSGPNAVFLVNVIADGLRDKTVRKVRALLKVNWPLVRVLSNKTGGSHNALVMAGGVAHFERPTLIMPPRNARGALRKELSDMIFRD
jgi:spermidine synthase